MNRQLDSLAERLREQGYRLTPQRIAVLRALAARGEHLSAQELHDRVREEFPMLSLATVYSTLALLKEIGLVLELTLQDGTHVYDAGRSAPHPHLICTQCERVLDLELDVLNGVPQQIAQSTGYRVTSHRFDMFGVCPACQKRERSLQQRSTSE
jgi:Fur family peroxide stress response transcriptional regulator